MELKNINFKNAPHVAFFVRYLKVVGGIERNTVIVANELSERGYNVDIVVAKGEGRLSEQLNDNIRTKNFNRGRLWKCIIDLNEYIEVFKPDVIISFNIHQNIVSLLAKIVSKEDTKVITTECINVSEYLSKQKKLSYEIGIKVMIKLLYPLADLIAGKSEGVVKDIKDLGSFSMSETKVIHNPVVSSEVLEKALEEPKNSWLHSKDHTVILGVGRLHPQKNFSLLIRAFGEAHRQNPGLRLIILGEGNQRSKLESITSELDLSHAISLPGYVSNPYSYMAKADLFVLSSDFEGFGNVVAEALACGCPVVSTDCPSGPREILEDGKWGMLVPPGDADALSAAMIKSLNQSHDQKAYRKRGAMFSVERSIDKYEEAVSRVVG